MESGQSAAESKILSRDVVVSGGLAECTADKRQGGPDNPQYRFEI